jgi:hypothetical protein
MSGDSLPDPLLCIIYSIDKYIVAGKLACSYAWRIMIERQY